MQPAQEYRDRLRDCEAKVSHSQAVHIRLGNLRLVLAVIIAIISWQSFNGHTLSPWWILLPLVVFIGIALYHSRILKSRDRAEREAAFYKAGLARIEDRWAGTGETGERFNDPHHEYAADLDLFGKGSLFELLSTAHTRMGEETLAGWLLAPSSPDEIAERHVAVGELRGKLNLREDLAVLGADAGVGVHPEALIQWAEAETEMKPAWLRVSSLVLAGLAMVGTVVWGYFGIAGPFFAVIVLELALRYSLRKSIDRVLLSSEHVFHDLGLLSGVLARVEQQTFSSLRLKFLQRELLTHTLLSSEAIARLKTIIDFSESRRNMVVALLDVPLMYSVQVAFAADGWRSAHGHAVRKWLNAIGEIEALVSLGTYSYEHPDDPFPELAEGEACFEAEEIGHPLVPVGRCVRNGVSLRGEIRVLLVSGSNMSGKSTLLRTIGINAVLAMAGAPVRARHLRLTSLHVGASIRINDSLQEGSSRFYAEITRLRKLFDLAANDPPLLFLLDELLQGTNSNDRRVGAEGVLHAFLNRGAIGMVSTHDLALAEVGGPNGHVHNVHFQEEFESGEMHFDYKLREGVVTKSNALALMRSIGLDV